MDVQYFSRDAREMLQSTVHHNTIQYADEHLQNAAEGDDSSSSCDCEDCAAQEQAPMASCDVELCQAPCGQKVQVLPAN